MTADTYAALVAADVARRDDAILTIFNAVHLDRTEEVEEALHALGVSQEEMDRVAPPVTREETR
jgi:hypothetical protein